MAMYRVGEGCCMMEEGQACPLSMSNDLGHRLQHHTPKRWLSVKRNRNDADSCAG